MILASCMEYISTRGGDTAPDFKTAVMAGLASDGGLFVPAEYPKFSAKKIAAFKNLSYHELAYEIISPYVGDSIPAADLKKMLAETYSPKIFHHPQIAPLKKLYEGEYILELFHGPTLAFKDFALQFLGRVFDYFLAQSGEKINILGATSGDTGSAAIAGCMGRKNINIFILHPKGRVSEVQRRQMTTVLADNVFNIAIEGNFDDCQNLVKEIFGDPAFKKKYNLSAVNSINWARIVAQIVYYFYAALQLGAPSQKISFSVPTGNFGDILAGYIAHKMGLPVEKLVIATNSNDILHRFLTTGTYKKQPVIHTLSPSMDIQISSNFERLLFDYHKRKGQIIKNKINDLNTEHEFSVETKVLAEIGKLFASDAVNDTSILEVIGAVYAQTGESIDPHTAVGFMAGRNNILQAPMVTLATAHPAKFPEAVKKATGLYPLLPTFLSHLHDSPERFTVLHNQAEKVREFIMANN